MMPYFIFKGIDSRNLGVYVNTLPPIQTVDNEVEFIEIPGRDGYLTILKDRKPMIEKTISITIKSSDNMEAIKNWLTGSGLITFSNEPNLQYQARIQTIRELWTWDKAEPVTLLFYCQPNPIEIVGALDDKII